MECRRRKEVGDGGSACRVPLGPEKSATHRVFGQNRRPERTPAHTVYSNEFRPHVPDHCNSRSPFSPQSEAVREEAPSRKHRQKRTPADIEQSGAAPLASPLKAQARSGQTRRS